MTRSGENPGAFSPYLSVVAASRNDDHGGDPLIRTQIFVNTFARQCEKYQMPAELILVDWNPVPGRPGLAAVLSLPPEVSCVRARVVTVPVVLHQRIKYADRLPLFQMIAKNVGIRRARGKFILATNIDILFSDELMKFISGKNLDPGKQYRVDRYDIQNGLSLEVSVEEALDYAWNNPIRTHRRFRPERLVEHLYGTELFSRDCAPHSRFRKKLEGVAIFEEHGVWQVRPDRSVGMSHLHTNACGDFALLSREGWDTIRGYPEFASYSFNIDSIGLIAAHYAGFEEVSLLPPCVCFHIEHSLGSGWTPEGEKKLMNRLRLAGILNPEWPVLTPLVEEMRTTRKALRFNHDRWGLAEFDLPEQPMGDKSDIAPDRLERLETTAQTQAVSAIEPAYDLDRLTLAYERDLDESSPGMVAGQGRSDAEKVVLYIPSSDGNYQERHSIAYLARLDQPTTVVFHVDKYAHQFPLRFDPCQCPGLINIHSLTIYDSWNHRVVWELDDDSANTVAVNGTAVGIPSALAGVRVGRGIFYRRRRVSHARQPLRMVSTGLDPQLLLPPLTAKVGFPLIICAELKLTRLA